MLRELETDRGNLRNSSSPDKSEDLVKTVIKKFAKVQKRLVEDTDLRQEEELRIAIEIAMTAIINHDHDILTNYQANNQVSD